MSTSYTPIYRIEKDGVDITNRFNDRTTSIKVELTAGGGSGDRCEIMIDDRDWALERPAGAAKIQVWLGYQEIGLAYMGTFEVDDVILQGMPRSMQLTGTSTGFNDMKKAPQIANWDNKSVAEILGEIAGQSGLGMSISEELGSMKIPFKNQVVSNLHLIHELERVTGAVGKVVDCNLMFVPRDADNSASGISLPLLVLQPEHFGQWRVRFTSTPKYTGVKARWWDEASKTYKAVEAGVTGLLSGGAGATPYTIGSQFLSQAEALAGAQSKARALKRAEKEGNFDLAKGDPWIRDQQKIIITKMREGINGGYTVDKAIHTYIKSTGIRTTLECRAPGDDVDYSDLSEGPYFLLQPKPGEPMGTVIPDGSFNGSVPF